MAYPFNIKFCIFDKRPSAGTQVWTQLVEDGDLHDVVKKAVLLLGQTSYKTLQKFEPVVASLDETKQLRLACDSDSKMNKFTIIFHQKQSIAFFSVQDCKAIAKALQQCLEEYLGYKIADPIIFIETGWVS